MSASSGVALSGCDMLLGRAPWLEATDASGKSGWKTSLEREEAAEFLRMRTLGWRRRPGD